MTQIVKDPNQHGFAHHVLLLALAVTIGVASFGTYSLVKSKAATVAPSSSYVYLAPAGKCSDASSGANAAQAVCSLTRVQAVITGLQGQGLAKGNIYIRLENGSYTTNSLSGSLRSMAAAGYTTTVAPSWYLYNTTSAGNNPIPNISCSAANQYGLSIGTGSAGAVKVAFLRIHNCTHGMVVGGDFTYNCPANPVYGTTRIIGSYGTSLTSFVGDHLTIDHIGNKYIYTSRTTADRGEAGINMNNTQRAVISNSLFTRLENVGDTVGYIHAIYAKGSSNVSLNSNYFSYISGDPIRERHSDRGFVLRDNTFALAGRDAITSDWHYGRAIAIRDSRCLELASQKPLFYGNHWNGAGYGTIKPALWRVYYAD